MGCGCMETPGYGVWMHGDGVKMQWMHGDPWVWDVDAWRPLGMGCGCMNVAMSLVAMSIQAVSGQFFVVS